MLPYRALADCTAPDQPGVRICAPSQNAKIVYIPALDFNSTPAFGAQISRYIVYDNGSKIFEGPLGQTGTTFMDPSMQNGLHRITIHAWDTLGHLYEAKVAFTVFGSVRFSACPVPSSLGINFCEPVDNTVLGTKYQVSATARGNSRITAIRLYIDGKEQFTNPFINYFVFTASVGTQGDHTIAAVAWDTGGHVFTKTRKLHSAYTYGLVECPEPFPDEPAQPCSPGFDQLEPVGNDYVTTPFTMQVQVKNNPRTVTAIKAYIDGILVATSDGPTMMATVQNAPTGTHIVTLQAWDTAGILYRFQYSLNINMTH